MSKEQKLKEAAEPLIKYLRDNYNPHMVVIITPTSIELLSGEISIPEIFENLRD